MSRRSIRLFVAGLLTAAFSLTSLQAQDRLMDLTKVKPPTGLIADGATAGIAARTSLMEGPAFDARGDLYFSEIYGNRIYRMTPDGKVSVFRADSGRTNGNAFDAQGRLVSCEGAEQGPGGRRRIVRTDMKTGVIEVLTDRFEGKRYNSPNDLCIDAKGQIWFTDPYYGDDRSMLELDAEALYRIETDGTVTRVLSQPQIERPNGLALTPDGQTLYVIDSHTRPGGNRKVWAFQVEADGKVGGRREFFNFGKGRGGDGLKLDARGNLWIAAGIMFPRNAGETADVPPGVYVLTPKGELLGRIDIPEDLCTNLTFGGPGGNTLYVTAGKTLFKIPVAVGGASAFRVVGD